MEKPEFLVISKLKEKNLTLGIVESATGGLISNLITDIPGSSEIFKGAIVSYSNEIKTKLLGVKSETLETFGAASSQVAEEMAEGGRKALDVDICISDTGIAGPTGATFNKPIGLFYIGISHKDGTFNRKFTFKGNREENKKQAAYVALSWVIEYVSEVPKSKPKISTLQIKPVVTCFLESNDRILILKRSEKVGTYQGQWAGISGYVESTPDKQAIIEIREETGLKNEDIKLIHKGQPLEVIDEKLKVKWIVNPFMFHVNNPKNIKIDWEHKETKWIKASEFDEYITVPRLKEALNAVMEEDD